MISPVANLRPILTAAPLPRFMREKCTLILDLSSFFWEIIFFRLLSVEPSSMTIISLTMFGASLTFFTLSITLSIVFSSL